MKIAVKEVGKDLKIVDVTHKYRSDCVKDYIGERELPQFISLNQDYTLLLGVDEEGLCKELPLNFFLCSDNRFFPIEAIVGPAVFCRVKPVDVFKESVWDFEIVDLTDDDLKIIEMLLNENLQAFLLANFDGYKNGGIMSLGFDDFFNEMMK